MNMGVLLAAQDPTHLLGRWCVAPAFGWSRFSYRVAVSAGLNLAGAVYRIESVGISIFVNALYDERVTYEAAVIPALQTQCTGLRLIFGGSTGLAKGIYYNCLSGIDMGQGTYSLVQLFTVELFLFRCACVTSVGQEFLDAQAQCMLHMPATIRGVYQARLPTPLLARRCCCCRTALICGRGRRP